MESVLLDIISAIKSSSAPLDAAWLDRLLRKHNRQARAGARRLAKRDLLPYYFGVKERDAKRWESWGLDAATEHELLRLLKMKPRRTASGVATITVITKPWPCSSDCLYCPNDVRVPKSYLAHEPACRRAERNYFDPYLQVRSRLVALHEMGHVTDKLELIVLGGTWSDYPEAYQLWFVSELFRAANDFGGRAFGGDGPAERDRRYRADGFTYDPDEIARRTAGLQRDVNAGTLSYNAAVRRILGRKEWERAEAWQVATWDDLGREQRANETAPSRVVGLTIETRPDLITAEAARTMRRLGCTKVQMGIQSLNQDVLAQNCRDVTAGDIAHAFATLRLAGYKIQVHMMANLLGSNPAADRADYLSLVSDPRFLPDEVKLYPCCLVESARLNGAFARGDWEPYTEDELVGLLVDDTLATPPFTRISRMVRDIPSTDITAGNKKTNLRQAVEAEVLARGGAQEIRLREVATDDVLVDDLRLDCVSYATTVSDERFLQWVTAGGRIAGFLRLSLPKGCDVAMIREVHVYGRVAGLHATERGGAQHAGLGRALVEEACAIAERAGYAAVDVISAVGTRGYYRSLGFADDGLYQRRPLAGERRAATRNMTATHEL